MCVLPAELWDQAEQHSNISFKDQQLPAHIGRACIIRPPGLCSNLAARREFTGESVCNNQFGA